MSQSDIRDEGERLCRDLVIVDPAPEDIHIQAALPLGAGQYVVVDIAGLPVGILYLVTHNLRFFLRQR